MHQYIFVTWWWTEYYRKSVLHLHVSCFMFQADTVQICGNIRSTLFSEPFWTRHAGLWRRWPTSSGTPRSLPKSDFVKTQGQIVHRSSAIVDKSGNINISTNLNFLTLKNCFSTPKIFLKMCEHLVILSKLNALKNLLYMKEY